MDQLKIVGGKPLHGEIAISGAKNAALPLMIATILSDETLILNNSPDLADIQTLTRLLESFGTEVEFKNGTMKLTSAEITSTKADYDLVRKMRASVCVLGPLLARMGKAEVSLPGGCAIGTRPVDLHLTAMEALGAEILIENGYIHAHAPNGLTGAEITFEKVSVGATENALMAATLAKGTTVLRNAAKEPEVSDLAHCLNAMGAKITGIDTATLTIEGVEKLHGTTHAILPDRIEAGSYAIAAAMTGGNITLTNVRADSLDSFWKKLKNSGANVEIKDNETVVVSSDGKLTGVDIMTEPYPGYPTDLQAQIMALNCIADGAGMITETIFENRFMHVPELCRLGANITVHGSASALVRGVKQLKGAPVMATDLRASMALVLAGLVANGETTVSRIYHLDRGYDNLVGKLKACGADIKRVKE